MRFKSAGDAPKNPIPTVGSNCLLRFVVKGRCKAPPNYVNRSVRRQSLRPYDDSAANRRSDAKQFQFAQESNHSHIFVSFSFQLPTATNRQQNNSNCSLHHSKKPLNSKPLTHEKEGPGLFCL